MSNKIIQTKWWSGGDNKQLVQLKNKATGQPIDDLTGATITARLMSPADSQIGGIVPQSEATAGADWATALIHVKFATTDSTWTSDQLGNGHYLQLKVVHNSEVNFYETGPIIELEAGF